jgi:protein ImuA
MDSSPPQANPEDLHPSLWRASQPARADTHCVDTGHPALSAQLPGGGWPAGTLTELLQQQHGIGELRLLGPTLARVADRLHRRIRPRHLHCLRLGSLHHNFYGYAPKARQIRYV